MSLFVTDRSDSYVDGGSKKGSLMVQHLRLPPKNRIVLNVGGWRHETYLSTLRCPASGCMCEIWWELRAE
ncbi:Hypp2114 [Branchiostoma lanceolatum]|uniref:Hypp2114 protein n=1 Tax=Branchiostoma lanceolatum TaxID=7740 RepID=A0A8J9ZP04_BRALA|nr:Hypp2114 [Branchiostoma lanceolatum]